MEAAIVYAGKYYKTVVLIVVVLPILALLAAIVLLWNQYVFPTDLILFFVMYAVTALGITVGYHRMLTHQSFRTFAPIKALILICGCMGFEGSPLPWAATHTYHHAHSDEEGDPHSPLDGFWHAHIGWVFRDYYQDPKVYIPQLAADSVVRFVDRTSVFWAGLSLAIPFLIGGWTGLLWGGFVRMFFTSHLTWSVNSICHTFGQRTFETTDESRNNWLIGFLAFGEGWHNNHHAFPTNAFHGMRWWQCDLSGLVIRIMEWMGLVWNVQRVSREAEVAHRLSAARSQSALQSLRLRLMHSLDAANAEVQKLCLTSIESIDHDALQTQLDESMKNLEKIRSSIISSLHIKRPRLAAYQKQVELSLEQARKAVLRVRPA